MTSLDHIVRGGARPLVHQGGAASESPSMDSTQATDVPPVSYVAGRHTGRSNATSARQPIHNIHIMQWDAEGIQKKKVKLPDI